MLKLEGNARGGKQKSSRGRGRGKKTNYQNTDLVVTVSNEESSSSRLKPPVTVSQPRKIVRLNRKTESTDLGKVTVKSLDEIKREKEQRLQKESATSSTAAHATSSQAGASAEDTKKDEKPLDNLNKSVKTEPDSQHEQTTITKSEEPSATSSITKLAMTKKLTVSIKSLPPSRHKILPGKQPVNTAISSPAESNEVSMDLDSNISEQDFDYFGSDATSDYDEDILLSDNEEGETREHSQNQQNAKDGGVDDGSLSHYVDYSDVPRSFVTEEDNDELISLHPDDSLFDEEDEFSPNSNRLVRPRLLERRSVSESKDTEEQEKDIKGKPENDSPASHHIEKSDNVLPRPRGKDLTPKVSNRREDRRQRPNVLRGRGAHSVGVSRRGGHGLRPGPRRESGSNVAVPPLMPVGLPRVPHLLKGDGLLGLPPGLPNPGLLTHLQVQLESNIQSLKKEIKKTAVEILTNPPPVLGEHVSDFAHSKHRQPYLRQGSHGSQDSSRMSEPHPPKRPQSRQMMAPSSTALPKWLQRTVGSADQKNDQDVITNQPIQEASVIKTGGEVSNYEKTEHTSRPNDVPPGFQNAYNDSTLSDIDKLRLARENHSRTDYDTEMQAPASKRKSSYHGEEGSRGGKIVVTTSPEGLPQPGPAREWKTYLKGYCFKQLNTGHCSISSCKYRHLSNTELLEFQRTQQLRNANSQKHIAEVTPEVQVEQATPVVQETPPQEEVPAVSYQLVAELLTQKQLGPAWQMIEKLCRTSSPDFDILRRTLVVCSEHLEEPDIAAKVACQAFDKIERSGQPHRHDFTVLIKTLCHSGQYIRAYQMLDAMKKKYHKPTYEVFLDLVQASSKDPDWAFNLLDEIKQFGLFKSGICSDLILLGCNSGEHFIERTWLLCQEALHSQVHMSEDAVQAMLFTLSHTNNWERIMMVIAVYPDSLPTEMLTAAVLSATKRADWLETILEIISALPVDRLKQLGSPEVWNTFLSNCCTEHASNMSFAQKIYSLMQQIEIPLAPQTTNTYMSALTHSNNWSAALELFNAAHVDPKVLEQPQVLEGGLIALTTALSQAGATVRMLTVVHFMLEHQLKPEDRVLQSAVESLDKEKNYKGVHQFFHQLKAAAIVPPMPVLRHIISSLEKWVENPTASVEPYLALRHAYAGSQYATNKEEVSSSDSNTREKHRPPVCKYIGSPRGCLNGDACRFVHPVGSSLPEGSNQGSGGSTPGSATGSGGEKRTSNPFVLQGQSTQPAGSSPTPCQPAQSVGDHTVSHIIPESLQYVPQTTTVNTMSVTEKPSLGSSHGSEASLKSITFQNQSQGTVCHFFGTPQGCRNGDNCRFIHHESTVSLSANPLPVMSERVIRHSSGPVSYDLSGNPFVLKDPTSSGQAAGSGLFVQTHDQPTTAHQAGFHSGGPFPSVTWRPPVSGAGSHHFQLAGSSHFTGTNPFSLSVPGRSQSLEDFSGDQRGTDQNRQAHSAPIVPEIAAASQFQFPSKKGVQFYLPRIKHASEKKSWEDLAYVYVNMKNESVEIDHVAQQAFFHAFEINCPESLGECFDTFSKKMCLLLKQRMQKSEPDCSPGAMLDNDDKCFLGELGVALMYLSYTKQRFKQGYFVLHVLHERSINYSLYSAEFGVQGRPLTTTEVALTAADICLHLDEPAYSSALEVLRGTNFALPAAGTFLTPEEADWRRNVFHALCHHFISSKEFHDVSELLDNVGNPEVFGGVEIRTLYNAVLRGFIENGSIDEAANLFKRMEFSHISREPESVRALVNGYGKAGRTRDAKLLFLTGVFTEVYPAIFNPDNPWTVTVFVSFSALEIKLYIEKYLNRLQEYIEQNAPGALDDDFYRPLTVGVKSDEVPSLYSSNSHMVHNEVISATQERVCTVLSDEFNPPLSSVPQSQDGEIVVSAMSLRRWFLANPSTGRLRGGSFGQATAQSAMERAPPYLQPGMSNVVSTNGQEGEGRKVSIFSKTDKVLPALASQSDKYQHRHSARKNVHGQRFASSTRKM